MTILEEEKQTASTVGTTIPSSISSSGGTGPGPVNLKTALTAAVAAAAAAVSASNGYSATNKTSGDPGINNNTGAKNHILNSMISNVADRYITPEYLAPLPQSEKIGKSPLQLLAQTCSQIGADPGSNKNSSSGNGNGSNENKTKEKSKAGSPALIVADNAVSPNGGGKAGTQVSRPVSFKPYETDRKKDNKTPSSVVSLSPSGGSNNNNTSSSPPTKSPTSASASTGSNKTTSSSSASETTPVIRSGMEVLAGHQKDLHLGLYANPAFRPSSAAGAGYPGGGAASLIPPTTLAASLAAAAAGSLGSSVCRDPYCRDPTCPTAMYNAQLAASLMASGLPPGYAELLQAHAHKAQTTAAAAASAANGTGPYICNWMNGREGYCGKRHNSAEELLQHLRTHTNLSTSDSAMYSASAHANLMQRGYGSALSSMSPAASRFHPYAAAAAAAAAAAKTSALPSSLSALGVPPPPAMPHGLPPSLYSPAAASSLYASLYGVRLAGSLP